MANENTTTKKPPEMLTIRECAARGVLPEHFLRRLVAKGKIRTIKSGTTNYINYDKLVEDLANESGKIWNSDN